MKGRLDLIRRAAVKLIYVTPERLEVVSEAHGIGGDSRTWRPPAVEFDTGR